ncbi:pheromone receptor [Collybia nuda]|uniref:Pheromone receptor n=1 Tax=Collybia nuda TaxID=64659 RepID=A0A9P5XYG7_9AGAR|nr:pheromone receptor [Collybia nuda]
MSYPNYVFSIFAFIGFVLAIIPLRWHLDSWNAGTCLYMLWTAIACLNQFINSIVWDGNVINHAPIWCDISIRIILGASMAIPAASLCINRRLYRISRLTTVKITKAEKLRDIGVDLAIALGVPILFIILSYIPQGHRFDIYEDLGCVPVSYMTPVQLALVQLPPVAIGFITAIYSVLSMRAFFNRNRKLQALISDHKSMNTNRYFRLMCLAGIDVLLTVPLGSYAAYQSITTGGGIHPWISWEDTHWGFARHEVVPAFLWRRVSSIESAIEFNRWQIIICSFIFFGFFGFAEEARHNYRSAFWSVAGRFGYTRTVTANSDRCRIFFFLKYLNGDINLDQ